LFFTEKRYVLQVVVVTDISRVAIQSIDTDLLPIPSVCLSVCRSVGRSVWRVYCGVCGKMADWIWVPFGVVTGVGRGMGILDEGPNSPGGRSGLGRGGDAALPKLLWHFLLLSYEQFIRP